MSDPLIGIAGILFLVVLMFTGMPIAFVMAIVGFSGIWYLLSPAAAAGYVIRDFYNMFASYSFATVPMFIWMGYLALGSGVSGKLYEAAHRWLGQTAGGLAMATEVASAAFGAICGSPFGTITAIGAISFPEMDKRGYDRSLSTATIASGGLLGILIPPSTALIIYGIATEQPIGRLFMGSIIPGILQTILYCAAIYLLVKRKPSLAPAGRGYSWKEKLSSLPGCFGTVAVFVATLVGLFLGWFTPTEAGAFGSACLLILSLITRTMNWKEFVKSIVETMKVTAMILLILASATVFGRFITLSGLSAVLANWIAQSELPTLVTMGMIFALYFILGCFLEGLSIMLITLPIFYPIVCGTFHYSPIWFGVALTVIGGAGALTPPVGMQVYVTSSVTGVPLGTCFKGIWPFVGALVVGCILLILFPGIVTMLPDLLMRK